jgi:hypothetical protein
MAPTLLCARGYCFELAGAATDFGSAARCNPLFCALLQPILGGKQKAFPV